MLKSKLNIYLFLVSVTVCFFIYIQPVGAYDAKDSTENTTLEKKAANSKTKKAIQAPPVPPSREIIVYYFHGTRRCRTCKKIESLSETSVKNNFQAALKNGTLVWKPLNVDTLENKHFIKDYNLYTRSVVLAEIQNDKQVRWKNLDQVWQLVQKEDIFKNYIRDEIEAYLKGE